MTVISIVGIPPTLVAGICGMNFKSMPELSWARGYQWGLALMALSAVVPIVWFKWRKWLRHLRRGPSIGFRRHLADF